MSQFGSFRATLNGTVLLNVTDVKINRREKTAVVDQNGNLHASFATIRQASPSIDFTCGDLKSLLVTKLNNADLPMVAHATGGLVVIAPLGNTAAPGFITGALQAALATGQTFCNGISWSVGNAAMAACTGYGTSADGTTDPLVVSAPASPAQTARGTEYTLQSLTVGGVSITDCTNFDLQIGNKATNDAPGCFLNGLPFPTSVRSAGGMGATEITGTITFLDLTTAFANGTIVAVFAEKADGAPGVTANTVTVTLNTSLVMAQDRSGGTPSQRTIRFIATHDGTNRPLTIA